MKKKLYDKPDMTLDDFKEYIEKTYRGKYAGKYTLDESTWVDKDTPMSIHCREHGWFTRKPIEFGKGFVCPYESNAMRTHPEWLPIAFEEKARIKYGDRFEYNLDNYVDCKHDIEITCTKHNLTFNATPDEHLLRVDGCCPECFKDNMHNRFVKPTEQFIEDSKKIWGDDIFDYSKTTYVGRKKHLTLICKKHDATFTQLAYKHLLHHDQCPFCLTEANIERNLMETDEFIRRATIVHNGRYGYDRTDTKHRREDGKVEIYCPIHEYFWQDPQGHLAGSGCPKCGGLISKPENEIRDYIKENLPDEEILQGKYGIIGRKQLDLYLPNKNIAIEFNGLYWHTEEYGKDRTYHLSKLEEANIRDIQLIHIFEDEWIEHKDIVLSKIAHSLKFAKFDKIIRGHKCKIKEISNLIAKPFFEENHIQGFGQGSVILGALYDNELIGACIFKKDSGNNCWELTRMATKNNYLCHGVCGKMFKTFIKDYNPSQIKSFADRRWTLNKDSNLYTALGFKLDKILDPDYRYVVGNKRIHKFNFRKQALAKKYGLPLTMTENEMTQKLGFQKIWDCGLFKYVWYNSSLQ